MRRLTKAYLSAVGALYGDTPPSAIPKRKSCNAAKRRQPERDEQIIFCTWLDKHGILYYAIPNGGARHRLEAINLKRAGMKPGVPDICIPISSSGYHALYIELKSPKGVVSEAQKYWIGELNGKNNLAKVCYSAREAIQLVAHYLCLNSKND